MTVTLAPVHDDAGIEEAIANQAREPGGGLVTLPESLTITHRDVVIAAAARFRLPLMGGTEASPRAGGLMSYITGSTRSVYTRRRHPTSTAFSRAPARPTYPFRTRRNTR
jgi:hypothetical protein